MSDQVDQPARQPRQTRGWLVVGIALVLLVAAATFYFAMIGEQRPRHLKLALVTWTQDPFWEPLLRGAKDCAAQTDVELTVIRSEPTVEAQTKHLKDLLNSDVDGIAVSPNDAQAERAILDEVTAKVPVVTFDTDAPETKRRRFIGIDNYAAGRICADEVREALPDGGAVLISVGSTTQLHGRARRQGVIDGLLERGFDRSRAADPIDAVLKGPKYSVAATVTDGGDPAMAVKTIADALSAHPEVKCVVGLYSYSAPAALDAMKQIGKANQIKVVGFDESEPTQAAIEAGTIHSSVLQDSYRAGYESIEVLAREARGVAPGPAENSPVLNVGINVMTSNNIQDLRQSGAIRPMTGGGATTKPMAAM